MSVAPWMQCVPQPRTFQQTRYCTLLLAGVVCAVLTFAVGLQVCLDIVRQGVGDITENDVEMAATAGAAIFAFNVKLPDSIRKQAERTSTVWRVVWWCDGGWAVTLLLQLDRPEGACVPRGCGVSFAGTSGARAVQQARVKLRGA